jgi:hypothetical protein
MADTRDLTVRVKATLDGFTGQMRQAETEVKSFGAAAKEHTASASGLGKVLDEVGQHSRTMAMGLSSIGLGADAAAARVGGLADVFKGLGAAAPSLLAVTAGLTSLFAGVDILKTAVELAGRMQVSMVELGVVTKNQGGNWGELKTKTEEWLASASAASGLTQGDLAEGLRQLGAAGKVGADGFTYQRVAMELARATGMGLAQSEEVLIKAGEGQARMLVALGIIKRQDIKDGMTQQQMLQLVADRVKDAAAAYSTTLPGALDRVHAAWDTLLEKFGSGAVSGLATAANGFANMIAHIEHSLAEGLNAGRKFWSDFYNAHKAGIDRIVMIAKAELAIWTTEFRVAFDFLVANAKVIWDQLVFVFSFALDIIGGNFRGAWNDIKTYCSSIWRDITGAFGNFGDNMVTIASAIGRNLKAVFVGLGTAMVKAMTGDFSGAAAAADKVVSTVMSGVKLKPLGFGNDAFNSAAYGLGRLFAGGVPNLPGSDKVKLQNNSMIPGETGAGDGASNAMKNFEQSIRDWLAKFDEQVDKAKDDVERAKGALAAYQAKHGEKPQNAKQGEDQARLIGQIVDAELRAAAAANTRAIANEHAANAMAQYAKHISTALKNHDELVRSAKQAANEFAKQARDAERSRDATRDEAAIKAREKLEKPGEGAMNAASADIERVKAAYAAQAGQTDLTIAQAQYDQAKSGKGGGEDQAAFNVELAKLRDNLAQAAVAAAEAAKADLEKAAAASENRRREQGAAIGHGRAPER